MTREEAMNVVNDLQHNYSDIEGRTFTAAKNAFITALGTEDLGWHASQDHAALAIDRGMKPDYVVAVAMLCFQA